jgi:hypothetical protein
MNSPAATQSYGYNAEDQRRISYTGRAITGRRMPAPAPYLEPQEEEAGSYTYTMSPRAFRAVQSRRSHGPGRPWAAIIGSALVAVVLLPGLAFGMNLKESAGNEFLSRYNSAALTVKVIGMAATGNKAAVAAVGAAVQTAKTQVQVKLDNPVTPDPARPAVAAHKADYNVVAPPSVSAATIDKVLADYSSPAAGKGAAFYDLGLKYGIDPAYALAFYIHESSCGTKGVARFTHGIGNIRVTPGYKDYEGYRSYDTYEQGIEDWYKLIKDLYVDGWGLTTPAPIIAKYAPWGDNNNPDIYASTVKSLVHSWASK